MAANHRDRDRKPAIDFDSDARQIADEDYHIERARAELDCSYRADRHDAAEAHMKLAALHMERAKSLAATAGGLHAVTASTLPPRGH